MKIKPLDSMKTRPDVTRSKLLAGMIYGIVGGIGFALAAWGWDGYILSQSHAYLPWLNTGIGLAVCAIIGGTAGWLTAHFEKSLLGFFFWLGTTVFFAGLVLVLPLQITPLIISRLDPQLGGLLNYTTDIDFGLRFAIAILWITPLILIIGVAQLPITESAVFSTSFFGKVAPSIFCMVIMTLNGIAADSLVNAHFRGAIAAMDETIQFVLENQTNAAIDKALARKMHTNSLSPVKEYVTGSRQLFVGKYDGTFGEINVMIKFNDQWVDCFVLYGQPSFCKTIDVK